MANATLPLSAMRLLIHSPAPPSQPIRSACNLAVTSSIVSSGRDSINFTCRLTLPMPEGRGFGASLTFLAFAGLE